MLPTVVRRLLATVTVALGAFVAALAQTVRASGDFFFSFGGDGLDTLFSGSEAAAVLGAFVAVLVVATVMRPRIAVVIAGVGVGLLWLSLVASTSLEVQQRGLASGLILGGCASLVGTYDRRILQCALVVGMLSGFASARAFQSTPVRYADYLPPTTPTHLLVLMGVLAALLVLGLVVSLFDAAPARSPGTGRVLLVGIVVPLAGLVLHWLFDRSLSSLGVGGAMENRWFLGLVVIPLLVGAAFALPGLSGAVILAALAYIATATTSLGATSAAVFVVLLVAGVAAGWRWPSAAVGMGILVLVALAGVFGSSSLEVIDSTAQMVLLPFAIGLLFSSLIPTDSRAVTISLTTPIVVSVPIVAEYGWTAYTPLTSIEPQFSPTVWEWTSTAVSVVTVLVAAAALVTLQRRRQPD